MAANRDHRMAGAFDLDKPLYTISVASEILETHPRTLMMYEDLGLIEPYRTATNRRRYSQRNVRKLQVIQLLTPRERRQSRRRQAHPDADGDAEARRGEATGRAPAHLRALPGNHLGPGRQYATGWSGNASSAFVAMPPSGRCQNGYAVIAACSSAVTPLSASASR